jgi:uncharacterized protein
VKAPAPEPWVITDRGAEGDQVAVHSDHLYVFDRASYDYWAAELGVDRALWSDGHFAENLTVDTLDQSRLRVGDQYRVGSAIVVVTGPRVPCWKLTWRLGQPKPFMRRFRLSGRSGSYFGVLTPGVVRPGDEFELLATDETAPTVAELSRLCDSGTIITPEQRSVIDRALTLPDLSATVRATLDLKIANLERDARSTPGAWKGWRRFELDAMVAETAETVSFELRPADGGPLPAARPGQHVVVRLSEPGVLDVVRTWSLSSFSHDPEMYRITVKIRPDGMGGSALSRLIASGGVAIDLRMPAGRFHLDRGSFRPVVLIAAGIGITPMIAMIQAHLARDVHMPPLWLLYSTPDPSETAFREYLDEIFARHEDLNLHYFLTRTSAAHPAPAGATVHDGRISAERVIDVLRANYLRMPEGPADIPWFESDIYVCGPAAFNDAVRSGLVTAGANPDLVFVEEFVMATGEPVTPSRHTDAVVEFSPPGREATWVSSDEQTLLELAEDSGLEVPYDCRAGACRTCESTLICGDVDGSVSVAADGSRRVLLCVSFPRSDRVTVELPTP